MRTLLSHSSWLPPSGGNLIPRVFCLFSIWRRRSRRLAVFISKRDNALGTRLIGGGGGGMICMILFSSIPEHNNIINLVSRAFCLFPILPLRKPWYLRTRLVMPALVPSAYEQSRPTLYPGDFVSFRYKDGRFHIEVTKCTGDEVDSLTNVNKPLRGLLKFLK